MFPPKSIILFIDDDPVSIELFTESFKNTYEILTLRSTEKAVDVLNMQAVKVIVSDNCMPMETGIDFFKRINNQFPDPIKILLTAYSSSDTALRAVNDGGIYKYLLKPWKRDLMKETLDNAIMEFDLKNDKKRLWLELQKKNEEILKAYHKLELNERKFYTVFAQSSDSSFILNKNDRIIEANKAFLNLIGFHEYKEDLNELNAFAFSKFPRLVENAVLISGSENPDSVREITLETDPPRIIQLRTNEIIYNEETVTLVTIHDITDLKQFEKRLVDAIIQTQEDEQSRYARELHDGLGPLLSTLKMHIQWISNPNNSVNKETIISHAILTLDSAIKSVRDIANNLSPHILQRFGLVYAVRTYVERVKETSAIEFSITSNVKDRLSVNSELIIYRTVLECINNSIRHAAAKNINIRFRQENQSLVVLITDDGKGFDVESEMNKGKGMGLFNIQNRIRNIGGKLRIESQPGEGTQISIEI